MELKDILMVVVISIIVAIISSVVTLQMSDKITGNVIKAKVDAAGTEVYTKADFTTWNGVPSAKITEIILDRLKPYSSGLGIAIMANTRIDGTLRITNLLSTSSSINYVCADANGFLYRKSSKCVN